mgnify:CR=1 FL=1
MSNYIPISPKIVTTINENGNKTEELYSLKKLFPDERSTFDRLDSNDKEFKTPAGLSKILTVATGISLQFANIFSSATDIDSRIFVYDYASYTKKKVTDEESIIDYIYWGCSLRLVYRAWNFNSDINLDYSKIGLAVEAGLASADCQINAIGFNYTAFNNVLSIIEPLKVLKYEDIQSIINALFIDSTPGSNTKPGVKIYSEPIGVELKRKVGNSKKSIPESILKGMQCIKKGMTLSEAINEAIGYDSIWIKKCYKEVLKFDPKELPNIDNVVPKQTEKMKAAQWLQLEKNIWDL